jgi:hypothetical protein
MARKFQGIWIPSELWLTKEITMQEKLFLVEINSLDNEDGCFANNKYFSNFFDISSRRVSTIINNLIEKGFIKREMIYKDGTKMVEKRVLNICSPPYPTNVHEGMEQNFVPPIEQKFLDSNTVLSNTIIRTPYIKILKTWNETEELSEIRLLTDKRKEAIKKVYEIDDGKTFKEIVIRAINSNFMVEKKLTNIDWMMNENNYAKILEGKYDNKE